MSDSRNRANYQDENRKPLGEGYQPSEERGFQPQPQSDGGNYEPPEGESGVQEG
jgi:hypothetical protein